MSDNVNENTSLQTVNPEVTDQKPPVEEGEREKEYEHLTECDKSTCSCTSTQVGADEEKMSLNIFTFRMKSSDDKEEDDGEGNSDEGDNEGYENTEDEGKSLGYTFTENSDLYAISVDGVPFCYVKDEETASRRMWDITRQFSAENVLSGWRTSFVKVRKNELHLLGSYKFFLIAYDQVLRRVSYSRIRECV